MDVEVEDDVVLFWRVIKAVKYFYDAIKQALGGIRELVQSLRYADGKDDDFQGVSVSGDVLGEAASINTVRSI